MVINIGALKSRDYETVFEDICRVVKASAPAGGQGHPRDRRARPTRRRSSRCTLSKLAGAAFVKTSTGFGKGGATVEDVAADAPRRRRRARRQGVGRRAHRRGRDQDGAGRREPASARSASVAIVHAATSATRGRSRRPRATRSACCRVQLIREEARRRRARRRRDPRVHRAASPTARSPTTRSPRC